MGQTVGNRSAMQERRPLTFTKGTPGTWHTGQVIRANSQSESAGFFWVRGVGMSSLHSVTYRGTVSSKRACVWGLEILLWSGMLVVKTTGCKGIWPSLGYRGIIGWFHTKVNCSNVKSGKTGTFRNKTLGRGEIIFLFLFVVGATWFFSLKV